MERTGFDSAKYLKEQSREILNRIRLFKGKLYLEFGGKILHDYHAARVLPGYDPNCKVSVLSRIRDQIDIILCIYAGDIERGRIRGDFGISYSVDALKLIDGLREHGLEVCGVVITRFANQAPAVQFKNKLEKRGIKVYLHAATKGYPTDVDTIVSEEGYGRNTYIETTKPIVVVTGPGPGSGKLATCLSQLYHDYRRGVRSGYAKLETFPIWNLPLKHPVNVAYEAATADLGDVNMIDPYHLQAYGKTAVNYNRDVEIFPVLSRILGKIMGRESPYRSPTDMGVNRVGFAITDDALVCGAAKQELVRRYFRYRYENIIGVEKDETVQRALLLMKEMGLTEADRPVVMPARKRAAVRLPNGNGVVCGAALQLKNGRIVTADNSSLMSASSALVIHAIKRLSGIPKRIHLLSPALVERIAALKKGILGSRQEILDLSETLIALSISATTNPTAEDAMGRLEELAGCEVHLTHIPSPGDEIGLRRLRVNLTTDANFPSRDLFPGA